MLINKLTAKNKKRIKVLKLFIISLIFVGIAVSIAVVGCNYIQNRNFKETFYSVSSLKVNNKIRVIQISDLHNSKYGKDNEKLIERVKKLSPDWNAFDAIWRKNCEFACISDIESFGIK